MSDSTQRNSGAPLRQSGRHQPNADSVDRESYMPSPKLHTSHFIRSKYFSALKTGLKHMNPREMRESFLRQPKDTEVLPAIIPLPGYHDKADEFDMDQKKSSSLVIIFSCWNTMIGSALVALPWAFQASGLGLGILVSCVSFLISYYTCSLIIETAKNDSDYIFTLKKYYGMRGYYLGLVMPSILVITALTVYFSVICSNLYPVLFLILSKAGVLDESQYIADDKLPVKNFNKFSIAWVAVGVFFLIVCINMKRDLTFFIKMGFMGAMCASLLILFVIYQGIRSLTDPATDIIIAGSGVTEKCEIRPPTSEVYMFSTGFGQLAGCLCAGYFLHQFSLPIVKSSANPDKVKRDVFIGYLLVFSSFILVGGMGYFAFSGNYFKNQACIFTQNFLQMYDYREPAAVVVRCLLSVQMIFTYPLLNHFQRSILVNLFFRSRGYHSLEELPFSYFAGINIAISLIPIGFQLFYPNIGVILGIASSISALPMIYIVPVTTYFKMRKLEILYPMLAAAIQENEVQFITASPISMRRKLPKNIMDSQSEKDGDKEQLVLDNDDANEVYKSDPLPKHISKSPKIVISDRFLKRNQGQLPLPRDHVASFGKSSRGESVASSSDAGSMKRQNIQSGVMTDGVIPVGNEFSIPQQQGKKKAFMKNASSNNEYDDAADRKRQLRNYQISYAIHMLIPAYGISVVLAVLYNKFAPSS